MPEGVAWLAALLSLTLSAGPLTTATHADERPVDCLERPTITDLVTCTLRFARRADEGYAPPDIVSAAALRLAILQVESGVCGPAAVPEPLAPMYVSSWFIGADGARHCVLMETRDADGDGRVDRGWGTLVVRQGPARPIMLQAAHPIYDLGTGLQSAELYEKGEAWALAVAGSHRYAAPEWSACQGDHRRSDAPHNADHFLQLVTEALVSPLAPAVDVVQFHGKGASSCAGIDAFVTDGTTTEPVSGGAAARLAGSIRATQPEWQVHVPPSPCYLAGTTNVQGRLLNGVDDDKVCSTQAPLASGRFAHIEQAPGFRDADDWLAAVEDAWPAISPLPLLPADHRHPSYADCPVA